VLPDAENLTLAYLRARTELAGITFGTPRPADLADRLPFVLAERIGGAPRPCPGARAHSSTGPA